MTNLIKQLTNLTINVSYGLLVFIGAVLFLNRDMSGVIYTIMLGVALNRIKYILKLGVYNYIQKAWQLYIIDDILKTIKKAKVNNHD